MQVRNRKRFLSALTVGGAALALAARRSAEASAGAPSTPPASSPPAVSGSGSPPASPGAEAEKAPSAAALAVALTMRRFDAALSDIQITRIARDIDDGRAGEALNPKKKPLLNSDEPVTVFRVRP